MDLIPLWRKEENGSFEVSWTLSDVEGAISLTWEYKIYEMELSWHEIQLQKRSLVSMIEQCLCNFLLLLWVHWNKWVFLSPFLGRLRGPFFGLALPLLHCLPPPPTRFELQLFMSCRMTVICKHFVESFPWLYNSRFAVTWTSWETWIYHRQDFWV